MTMHTMSAIESAIVKGDSFFIMIFFPFVLDMSPGTFGSPMVKEIRHNANDILGGMNQTKYLT